MSSIAKKVILQRDPFAGQWSRAQCDQSVFERGRWPASWVHPARPPSEAAVYAYSRKFSLGEDKVFRLHVSADESYHLYLDSVLVGRGPERGCPEVWFYDSYEMEVSAGSHLLTAIVTALGTQAPRRYMSLRTGWLCCPEEEEVRDLLATGRCDWEVGRVKGITFERPFAHDRFSLGWNTVVQGEPGRRAMPFGKIRDEGIAQVGLAGAIPGECNRVPACHRLYPAGLRQVSGRLDRIRVESVQHLAPVEEPESVPVEPGGQEQELAGWGDLLAHGRAWRVPPSTRVRVLLNLGQYYAAYAHLEVAGGHGSCVRVRWAESLYTEAHGESKGRRDEIAGKYFRGVGDSFICGGGEDTFSTLWWRAGRYVEVIVETREEALCLTRMMFEETRCQLQLSSEFVSDDPRVQALLGLMRRTLEVSSHDGFIDPYYEQMMWVGDCYPTVLGLLAAGADEGLVRRCLVLFDYSRDHDGWCLARWPARDRMLIPTYGLLWIATLHAFNNWSGDVTFLRARLPGVRAVLEAFLQKRNRDGLLQLDVGWNFLDWVPGWELGLPPGGDGGLNASQQWMLVWALGMAAELEAYAHEPEMSRRWDREAAALAAATHERFWSKQMGLYADEPGGTIFSEHAQCLAVISGHAPDTAIERMKETLVQASPKTTIGFGHVFFEACYRLEWGDGLWGRLEQWFAFADQGLLTLPEQPEPTRSDCHAWGIYPWHHLYASVLGIRPVRPGYEEIRIEPACHALRSVRAALVHPRGTIRVSMKAQAASVELRVVVPEGMRARVIFGGMEETVTGGALTLKMQP